MDQIESLPALPPRPADAHKGTFGSVAVIGGSAGSMPDRPRMLGAPVLGALGAIRAGCGRVRIAAPEPMLDQVLAAAPFATGYGLAVGADGDLIAHEGAAVLDHLVQTNDALVIGTGMGSGDGATKIVLRAIAQEEIPVVVDADGLNALADAVDFARDLRARAVLTPHPGEAKRLCAALKISGDPAGDDEQRTRVCNQLAQRLGCVVVLKGQRTVVSNGQAHWVCSRGHPCMAVGGTGDVLAGIIGSLLAQYAPAKTLSPMQCAMIAVHAHAAGGERWSEENRSSGGMIAGELADRIPAALKELRE